MSLNFRKQDVKSKEDLIQTETLEIQTAPEIKESANTAIFKAAKSDPIPEKYFPCGISQTMKNKEYRKILMRQDAFYLQPKSLGSRD